MGSNMQRQAVPTLAAEKPLVGTGLERVVARDSGSVSRLFEEASLKRLTRRESWFVSTKMRLKVVKRGLISTTSSNTPDLTKHLHQSTAAGS